MPFYFIRLGRFYKEGGQNTVSTCLGEDLMTRLTLPGTQECGFQKGSCHFLRRGLTVLSLFMQKILSVLSF